MPSVAPPSLSTLPGVRGIEELVDCPSQHQRGREGRRDRSWLPHHNTWSPLPQHHMHHTVCSGVVILVKMCVVHGEDVRGLW